MELKDLANYGSFGPAVPGTRSLKKGEEEENAAKGIDQPQPLVTRKKGGMVGSASKRADGIAQRGKTRGRMV